MMAVHQNSVFQKEHRMFYALFTRVKEQVYISLVPTNILKIHFCQSENVHHNSFTNDLYTFILLVFHEWGPMCVYLCPRTFWQLFMCACIFI